MFAPGRAITGDRRIGLQVCPSYSKYMSETVAGQTTGNFTTALPKPPETRPCRVLAWGSFAACTPVAYSSVSALATALLLILTLIDKAKQSRTDSSAAKQSQFSGKVRQFSGKVS